MSKFSVSFEYFPWCLKAKFQIPPLRSVMFAVNTTTRAASNLDYLQFCSSQPLLSPGTVHQKFEWVFKILSEFSSFKWVLNQTPRFFQTPQILSVIWLKFWNFEGQRLTWIRRQVQKTMFLARSLTISFATTQTIAIYVCASPPSKKWFSFCNFSKRGCLSAASCPANQWSWSLLYFILNQGQSFGGDESLSVSTKDALSSCSTRAALNMEPTVMGWGIRGLDILDRGIKSCGSPPTNNFPFVLVPIHKGRLPLIEICRFCGKANFLFYAM